MLHNFLSCIHHDFRRNIIILAAKDLQNTQKKNIGIRCKMKGKELHLGPWVTKIEVLVYLSLLYRLL